MLIFDKLECFLGNQNDLALIDNQTQLFGLAQKIAALAGHKVYTTLGSNLCDKLIEHFSAIFISSNVPCGEWGDVIISSLSSEMTPPLLLFRNAAAAFFYHRDCMESKTIEEAMIKACNAAYWAGEVVASKSRDRFSNELLSDVVTNFIEQITRQNGQKGGNKRQEPMRKLKAVMLEHYKAKKWKSCNAAAYELCGIAIQESKRIGAGLVEQNAQRTLANWFREHKNTTPSG